MRPPSHLFRASTCNYFCVVGGITEAALKKSAVFQESISGLKQLRWDEPKESGHVVKGLPDEFVMTRVYVWQEHLPEWAVGHCQESRQRQGDAFKTQQSTHQIVLPENDHLISAEDQPQNDYFRDLSSIRQWCRKHHKACI